MENVLEFEMNRLACCLSGLVETGESVYLFPSPQEVCATHDVECLREALVGELCAWLEGRLTAPSLNAERQVFALLSSKMVVLFVHAILALA